MGVKRPLYGKLGRFLTTMLGALLLGTSLTASAKPTDITDAEMAMLPRYCPDTMGFKYGDAYTNTSPNAAKWVGMMGQGFWTMHHHCWGLIEFHRAERGNLPAVQKQGLLESALGNFRYVVNKTPSDFILLPEVLTWIGRTELLLKRPRNAADAFDRARKLKLDYWPAYSHWAEFLIGAGKRAEAKELVKTGLEYSPTARVLLEQYRVLGGKVSEIVPKKVAPAPEPNPGPAGTESAELKDKQATNSADVKPTDPSK